MKLLTANFLSCPIKTCKTTPQSFPLHFKDAELAQDVDGAPYSRETLVNLLSRLEWDALLVSAAELGFTNLPREKPEFGATGKERGDVDMMDDEGEGGGKGKEAGGVSEEILKNLWEVVMQTQIVSGKLVCGNCGYEFAIKEGIANFLLPSHLV